MIRYTRMQRIIPRLLPTRMQAQVLALERSLLCSVNNGWLRSAMPLLLPQISECPFPSAYRPSMRVLAPATEKRFSKSSIFYFLLPVVRKKLTLTLLCSTASPPFGAFWPLGPAFSFPFLFIVFPTFFRSIASLSVDFCI